MPDRHSLTELHRSTDDATGDPIALGWLPYADGAEGITWADPAGGTPADGGGMVPYFIASGDTFTVPEFKQALFAMTIDVEGVLDVSGVLIEVD